MEAKIKYPGLSDYFKSNPKNLIVILIPSYFTVYKFLKNGPWLKDEFTADEARKTLKANNYRFIGQKVLYALLGKRVIVATKPDIDKSLRQNADFHKSSGYWASAPSKTILKFNLDATIIRAEDKNEARKLQSFLSRITKLNGSTDYKMARKLYSDIKNERDDLIRLEKKISQCLNKINE